MASPAVASYQAPFELTRQQKVFTFVGVLLALFLGALDQTIVATAGPTIAQKLAIAPPLYPWLSTAYLLASTVMVPVWGRLSDLFGRKRVLIAGVSLFLGASALCGLSQNVSQLISFRALQGMGSACLFTSAFAVVADLFAPKERGRYSGIFGAVFGLSSVIGPLLGGFITDTFGWHWVFFINLPIGALAVTFIATRMPGLRRSHAVAPRVDIVGALLLAIAVVPVLFALSMGRAHVAPNSAGWAWSSPQIVGAFVVSAFGLVAFVLFERRQTQPLIDLSMFKGRIFSVGGGTVFVMGAVFLAPVVFMPLYMVNVVGVSSTKAGISTLPLVGGVLFGNIVSGQIVSRLGRYKALMLVGLAMLLVGLTVMSFTLSVGDSFAAVTLKMVLVGLGLGPSIPLYTVAIQNAVAPQQMGSATSLITFFRQMGSTIGVALAGTVFATTLASGMSSRVQSAQQGLPPELAATFSQGLQMGEGGPRGAQLNFDGAAVKAQLERQLLQERSRAQKALNGDERAAAAVAQSPYADARLKVLLANGGPQGVVHQSFEHARQRLETAAASEGAWSALAQATDVPVELSRAAAQTPFAQSHAALPRIREALDVAEQQAKVRAVAQARESLEVQMHQAGAHAQGAVDQLALALKAAFTDALVATYRLALALALLALLLTLLLPEVPLRSGRPGATAPAE